MEIPTLLVLGKLDFAVPYQTWESVIKESKNINYVLMENASHNPHTEESTQKQFNDHFISFLIKKENCALQGAKN